MHAISIVNRVEVGAVAAAKLEESRDWWPNLPAQG